MDPKPNFDVFVFDALFLDYFKSQNYLVKLRAGQVDNVSDLLEYARTGVNCKDGLLDAIPHIGCGGLLIYREGDVELDRAQTLHDVTRAIGNDLFYGTVPPKNIGLMVDFAGSTTDCCVLLDIYSTSPIFSHFERISAVLDSSGSFCKFDMHYSGIRNF